MRPCAAGSTRAQAVLACLSPSGAKHTVEHDDHDRRIQNKRGKAQPADTLVQLEDLEWDVNAGAQGGKPFGPVPRVPRARTPRQNVPGRKCRPARNQQQAGIRQLIAASMKMRG